MTPSPPITVALAGFDDLLTLGLRALLADDPALSVVGEVVGYELLSPTLRDLRPDVLIADAGALRDLAQVRELTVEHPGTHLVLFAEDVAAAERAQLLAFGASACLSWKTQARDVRSAIHLASRGMQLTPLASHLPNGGAEREPLLTPREGDVLLLLRRGLGNGQIALELQIGVETVRTHARHIYRKLGVSSRRALLALPSA
ncbi:MAG TPA: LuxR C-terminal-related transcriptional regulator [Thermoleophilaceae bacterium]|nr:LuxR C-terminal-related transcriptional regulator [Thermoleophilaceae bacterium]